MINPRAFLHGAALILPLAAVTSIFLISDDRIDSAIEVAGAAVLSAQVAALFCWRAIDGHAHRPRGGWQSGVCMALITHALFGPVMVVFIASFNVRTGWPFKFTSFSAFTDSILLSAIFDVTAIALFGWVTIPLTAYIANEAAKIRRKELVHVID